MTIFGIIWFIIIGFAFIKKDIKYMFYVLILGMIFQCNNVIVLSNGLSSGPQLITCAAFITKSFLYKIDKRKTLNRPNYFPYLLLLIYIIFTSLHFNNLNNIIMSIVQIGIYIYTLHRVVLLSPYIDENETDKIIKKLAIIILVIGYGQFFINLFNINRPLLFKLFIYNDINNPNIYFYKEHIRFYSTFMEPSYVACILTSLYYYFFMKNEKKRIDNILSVLLLISIIITFSTTAYLIFATIFSVVFLRKIKNKKTWKYIIIAIIALVILALGTNVLNKVIFQKSSSVSSTVRTIYNNIAYEGFKKSPVIGNGYKTFRASSIVLSILAELGIVGLFLYLTSCLKLLKSQFKYKLKSGKVTKANSVFIISSILAQLIACPDLDLCSFWLSLYISSIIVYSRKGVDDK